LIHELVITLPAGAAYGLPTFYFLIQGIAMLFERSRLGASLGLRRTAFGRVFAITVVTLPIFALFPEPFVLRVMIPFFQAVKALP
jgi:alginate O-acetyltransferase complex protein AlgI